MLQSEPLVSELRVRKVVFLLERPSVGLFLFLFSTRG